MILNLQVLQKVSEDRETIQMGSKEVSQECKKQSRILIPKQEANQKLALHSGTPSNFYQMTAREQCRRPLWSELSLPKPSVPKIRSLMNSARLRCTPSSQNSPHLLSKTQKPKQILGMWHVSHNSVPRGIRAVGLGHWDEQLNTGSIKYNLLLKR